MQQVEPNQAFSPARTDEAAAARHPGLLERAGVAHELGNLIQIASSAVNILARSSRFDVAPALEPVISGARASLDRAGVLVRQSLRQTESKAAEAERVDIAQSLREVMDLIQPAWAPKYRVELELGAALPAMKCAPLG